MEQGQRLKAGDELRFVVTTAAAGYLSVLSVDGDLKASPFYPDTDPAANVAPLRLDRSGRHELPGGVILDDAKGTEHLVVLFSPAKFSRAEAHRRLEQALRVKAPGAIKAAAVGVDGAVQIISVEKE